MTRSTRLPGVLFAAICLLGIASNASAQTFTWNTDAPGDWTTAANWNPVGFPDGQGDSAIFGSIITANRTVTLNSATSRSGRSRSRTRPSRTRSTAAEA